MTHGKVGTLAIVAGFLVVWLHMTAMKFHLYWLLPWFDSVVHFSAGLVVSLIILFILLFTKSLSQGSNRAGLIIFGTFIVGVLWEFFEHFFNIQFDPRNGLDTVIDLALAVLAAYIVYTLTIHTKIPERELNLIKNSHDLL